MKFQYIVKVVSQSMGEEMNFYVGCMGLLESFVEKGNMEPAHFIH